MWTTKGYKTIVDFKLDSLYRYVTIERVPPEVMGVKTLTLLVGGAMCANPTY